MRTTFSLENVGWTASSFSLAGVVLNALKIVWCWPVWIVGNLFWMYWAWRKREWSQLVLWIVFEAANVFGLYSWLT